MSEIITVSDTLELRAVEEQHVTPLHRLVLKNKGWLQRSLNWPQLVESEDDTRKNVQGNMMLHQGQGIMSRSLQALIHHYAQSGEIRRFIIKCRVDNLESNQVALRNGFQLEGCLKQAEFLNDGYHDVNLYARIIDSVSE